MAAGEEALAIVGGARSERITTSWTTIALACVLALVAVACGDDGDGDSASTTTTSGTIDDWATCESPAARYRVDHPADWHTNEPDGLPPCSLFDPQPVDVPPATEIPADIAVAITVEPSVAEPTAGGLGENVLDSREVTVDGRSATRVEVESTGDALHPEGLRSTRWSVGVDDQRIVARTHDRGELPYEQKQQVLDEMMGSLVVLAGGGTSTTEPPDEAEPVGEPGTGEVTSDDFPAGFNGDIAFLREVRVASHDGFDRVVLEFDAEVEPSYRVTEVERPIREDPSGRDVEIAGQAFLEVGVQPASGVDLSDGTPRERYTGPERIAGPSDGVVTEVVQTGDWESHLTWVVGLREEAPFAVATTRDPVRLVVDVVHDRGG